MNRLATVRFETKNVHACESEKITDNEIIIPPREVPGKLGGKLGQSDGIAPGLAGVSETMLWALHNRASEARKPDGVLDDLASVRIHEMIDYDFTGHFGDPHGSLAARAAEIDRTLRSWLANHPDGCIVSLGEGLETQRQRVDNGRMQWLSVDLPDAIRLRERFLAPTERFRHIAASALDPVWMDAVDPSRDLFIVAQGLLMYLEPEKVRRIFTGIADRFPGTEIVFDTIPCWFSHLTQLGVDQTIHYRLPSMPWGINSDEIGPTLRRWHPGVAGVALLDQRAPRGLARLLADMTSHIPFARHWVPSLVHVTIAGSDRRAAVPGSPLASETTLQPHAPPALGTARINCNGGGDLAGAARWVAAGHAARGGAAAEDLLPADHSEFARVAPTTVEAFASAGMAMLRQSGQASRQMLRLASEDVMAAALAKMQARFAFAWFSLAASRCVALGALAMASQAVVPTGGEGES